MKNIFKIILGVIIIILIASCGKNKTVPEIKKETAERLAKRNDENISLKIKPVELSSISAVADLLTTKEIKVFEVEGIVCLAYYETLQCDFKNYIPIKNR